MQIDYSAWIGRKVSKKSGKPFKSKNKVNTVKNIVEHVILKEKGKTLLAFTFEEDESYVDCRTCELEVC